MALIHPRSGLENSAAIISGPVIGTGRRLAPKRVRAYAGALRKRRYTNLKLAAVRSLAL